MSFKDWWRKKTTEDQPERGPWDSETGAELMASMWAANPALAAEVQRGRDRRNRLNHPEEEQPQAAPAEPTPLHAHEVTPNDAALMRMLAGARFGDDATVTLPSGKTITGAEMRRWLDSTNP